MADPVYSYNLETPLGVVRFLINDIPAGDGPGTAIFTDAELTAILTLEHGSVKRAAAQVIDTNATNEALASKVLRTKAGVETDGAKLADAMRKHAASLRAQADGDDEDGDGFYFDVIDLEGGSCRTERTAWPLGY